MTEPSAWSEALYFALSKLTKNDLINVCVYLGAACGESCDDLEQGVLRAVQEAIALQHADILERHIPALIVEIVERDQDQSIEEEA